MNRNATTPDKESHAQRTPDQVRLREHELTAIAHTLARTVSDYREYKNLTQKELAEQLGMKQPQVARIERGHHTPSIETLLRLAQVMENEFSIRIGRAQPGESGVTFKSQRANER